MRHDILSDVLSSIKNGDHSGKTEIIVPSSSLVKGVLMILQKNKYIGDFEHIDDSRGGKFKIQLLGNINNCGSIRPRLNIKTDRYEVYEKRFLPAAGIGLIILSTSKGLLVHNHAKEKKIGGMLLAFVY